MLLKGNEKSCLQNTYINYMNTNLDYFVCTTNLKKL